MAAKNGSAAPQPDYTIWQRKHQALVSIHDRGKAPAYHRAESERTSEHLTRAQQAKYFPPATQEAATGLTPLAVTSLRQLLRAPKGAEQSPQCPLRRRLSGRQILHLSEGGDASAAAICPLRLRDLQ